MNKEFNEYLKINEKYIERFTSQLQEIGVKNDTIIKIFEDINEHQKNTYEKLLAEMFKRLKEKLGDKE